MVIQAAFNAFSYCYSLFSVAEAGGYKKNKLEEDVLAYSAASYLELTL